MKSLFPPIRDLDSLPRRVLVVAPHSDDEIIGCGGVLAFHGSRGDEVRVLVLTDGAQGDPGAKTEDVIEVRRAESRKAGELLGIADHRFLGLPDGGLAECLELAERLQAEVEEFDPELVYAPSPQEMHSDHRAASRAAIRVLSTGREREVLLFGVNAQVTATAVFDTTAYWGKKQAALECFASQLSYHDLVEKCIALDRARTVNIEDPAVRYVEGFASLDRDKANAYEGHIGGLLGSLFPSAGGAIERPAATAVISTWNKMGVVRDNLLSLRAQEHPFQSIVVVDNASSDGTAAMIASEFPEVRLIVMPHDKYGACETFNIGFASVTTPLVAILDDDITLPRDWLRKTTDRMMAEPETTAVVSTKVVEPGMPESFISSEAVNRERYMSTFRGCGSLAKTEALRQAGFYDERLFIYGNERDLTCRLLNLGYRVLQYPEVETHHKTPFGIQMGKRSLFFHARNAWLSMLKYAPLEDLMRMPWLVISKVLLRSDDKETEGEITDATGTIGIGKSLRSTPGAPWILIKAAASVVYNIPYCMKRRQPVQSPDFELPLQ